MHVLMLNLRLGRWVPPDQARQKTAELLDSFQPGLISALMNYETVDGVRRTQSGFPVVQFGRLSNGFSLLGFGEQGQMILRDAVEPLAHAWSGALNRHVGLDTQAISCAIDKRPYAMRYRVPKMVIQKTREHTQRLADPAQGRALIEGLFLRSIERQCECLGLPVPEGLEARLLGAEKEFVANNGKGRSGCLGLQGATFELNARLNGWWAVGRLLSKGHGQFNASQQLGGEFGVENVEGGHALRQ